MFPYDAALLAAVQTEPQTVADVVRILQTIDATCDTVDGLKWFNWLYLQVTDAVEARVAAGGFADLEWLAQLDIQFANLYFSALATFLQGSAGAGMLASLFSTAESAAAGAYPIRPGGSECPHQSRPAGSDCSHLQSYRYRSGIWRTALRRLHRHERHSG